MKRAILIAVTMLVSIQSLYAATVIFESNAVISAVDTYDTVVVKGDDTVVTMTGGTVTKIITMDDSAFNMSGGNISTIKSHDRSVLDLSGNAVLDGVECYGNSSAYLSGDVFVGSAIIRNESKIYISENSQVSGIEFKDGLVDISGGYVYSVWIGSGSGAIKLSGGVVDWISTDTIQGAPDTSINVIGYDITALPYGGSYGDAQVVGHWNDDSAFSIELDDSAYEYVVVYDGVLPPDGGSDSENDKPGLGFGRDLKGSQGNSGK